MSTRWEAHRRLLSTQRCRSCVRAAARAAARAGARASAWVAVSLLVLVAGCTSGPEYRTPTAAQLTTPETYTDPQVGALPDVSRWWEGLGDPVLTSLVVLATSDNLDIAQASSRLRQARESLNQAGADRWPHLNATDSVGRNVQSPGADVSSASPRLDASWTVDLFGGTQRNVEAAQALLDASGLSLANVRAAVAAEVARNYVDYRTLQARLAIARETVATQDDNLAIATFRSQAGLVSALDTEQARAQWAATTAAIPLLERSDASARFRLALLVGQAPGAVDALLRRDDPAPLRVVELSAGVPADTLRQRPDVRVAERNLAAATARIGVARAQLYPALTLSANLGTSAASTSGLGDILTGGYFATLAKVIFDGGRLRSVARQRREQANEALFAYRQSVLNALEDVENALVARRTADARLTVLQTQVDASINAAQLARSNYRAGVTDFRTLLDAERTLLNARDNLASAQGERVETLIQLYLAVGGGWSPGRPHEEER